MERFNVNDAIKAQKEVTDGVVFAPSDGVCWHCGRNIYEEHAILKGNVVIGKTGYSVEEAGRVLITGCPHCHYSFIN